MAAVEAHAPRRLEGKVAIITGAASGIGAASARLFVENGARVIIADIQDELGKAVAAELGESAEFVHCDVTKEEEVAAAVDYAVAKHGGLDVMFNNAGVSTMEGAVRGLAEMNMEDFDKTMAVNVRGVVLGLKHGARAMIAGRRRGSVICTSSISGVLAHGSGHAYCMSKHAVLGVMKSAASEFGAYGLRVNAISPFVVETPLVAGLLPKLGVVPVAAGLPEFIAAISPIRGTTVTTLDIARAAVFLASEDAQFINGHNLVVDGGFTISKSIMVPTSTPNAPPPRLSR